MVPLCISFILFKESNCNNFCEGPQSKSVDFKEFKNGLNCARYNLLIYNEETNLCGAIAAWKNKGSSQNIRSASDLHLI